MKPDQRHQLKNIFEYNYIILFNITCVFQISHQSKIETSQAKEGNGGKSGGALVYQHWISVRTQLKEALAYARYFKITISVAASLCHIPRR